MRTAAESMHQKTPPVLLHFVYVYFPQNASSHFSLTPSSRILHQGLSSPRLRDNPFPAYWRCLLCDFGIYNKVLYLISLIILWHPSKPSKSVLSHQDCGMHYMPWIWWIESLQKPKICLVQWCLELLFMYLGYTILYFNHALGIQNHF